MNTDTIEYLTEIAEYYRILNRKNDDHREAMTRKAIKTLESLTYRLDDADEAMQLPGIGKSIGPTIEEFARYGRTDKLDELKKQAGDAPKYINKFMKIYGIGIVTAVKFYNAGYRQLSDIPVNRLTAAQKIGLKLYDDLDTMLYRREVTAIFNNVHSVLQPLVDNVTVVGSYRRGKAMSGDVDILVSTSDNTVTLDMLVEKLHEAKILSYDLALGDTRYAGVTSKPHRRIDIRLVKTESYPCALLYFTGSKEFNIAMRNRAREMYMKLNEYHLTYEYDETTANIHTEEDIFTALDMPYIAPVNRTSTAIV